MYTTPRGKEFIYGLTNREWKVYTGNVLADLSPEGIDRYGWKDPVDTGASINAS